MITPSSVSQPLSNADGNGDVPPSTQTCPNSIPSAVDLAAQYDFWLENSIIPMFREKYKQAAARLDLDALKKAATVAIGSDCNNVYKISQGGYNQVFLLTFCNGREVVARVNMRDGGGGELPVEILRERVLSEAATLAWVRKNTSIPVPEVYACDPCPNNAVGGAYILQERALGRRLDDLWYDDVTPDQRVAIMEQVSRFEGELFKTRFPLIGSIYCDPGIDGFRVGRLASSVVRRAILGDDRGPWTSIRTYLKAYVDAERTWLTECREEYSTLRRQAFPDEDPMLHISYFISLNDILGRVVDKAKFLDNIDPSIAPFVLFHEDICTNNILVAYDDPARVVAIVDWEGARVVPMWSCFQESQVAEPLFSVAEQCQSLQDLRNEIMAGMVPGLSNVNSEVGYSVQKLYHLISYRRSATDSVSTLNNNLRRGVCSRKPGGEDAFAELREFVDAQGHVP